MVRPMTRFMRNVSRYFEVPLLVSSLVALILLLGAVRLFASPVQLNGAGATFPEPIYSKWFTEFKKAHPSVAINYQGIGSGGGIRQLTAGTVDFGASDSPMSAEELQALGRPVLHIPTVLGAVVVSYNLGLSTPLNLSGDVVGEIFDGKIVKWNDAKIAKLNPKANLPDLSIVVATRSDGSGTTAVFTDYLSKVSPLWTNRASKVVDWFKGSVAAKGNSGVAGLISGNRGTIGYVELVYALENKLEFANIQNREGVFVRADLKSVSSAAAPFVADMQKSDFKLSITNGPGRASYPIASFTWLLIPEQMPDGKGARMSEMIRWVLSEKGQSMAQGMNYAPLPKGLRDAVLTRVSKTQLK